MKSRLLPAALFLTAAVFVVLGTVFPLWRTLLYFPQYPEGPLQVVAFAGALRGDLSEIELLNEYIGVSFPTKIPELVLLPRLLYGVAFLAAAAAFAKRRLGLWLKGGTIAALGGSLFWALWRVNHYLTDFGANPDPGAPLNDLVHSFKPPLWGRATIVQVEAVAEFLWGTYFLTLAGILLALGFWLALRQYKAENVKP